MASKLFSAKAVPLGLGTTGQVPKRVMRTPTHNFHLRHRPWLLQPCAIAPVLAGETLENVLLQSRVVTDPVKNPLIGWWLEYYIYYVPLRALTLNDVQNSPPGQLSSTYSPQRSTIEKMLLDQTQAMDAASYGSQAAKPTLYQYNQSAETGDFVNWLERCSDVVANWHFRDQDDDPAQIDDLNPVKLAGNSWTDSVYAADQIADQTVDVNATPTPDNFSVEEMDTAYQTYLVLKSQTMTELTFEDYLATFGVKTTQEDPLRPQLLRYVRNWSYPSNTIGTSGDDLGVPSSALSWSVAERADKKRFIREPGFIVAFTVARPKVYVKAQRTYAATMLADAFSWMPAVYKENVEMSLRKIANGEGPLGGTGYRTTKDYWVDLRDLFIYGDQFVNFALTETDAGIIAGPHASDMVNKNIKYPASADLDLLFANASPLNKIRQDGVVNLRIKGTQVDHT